MGSQTVPVLSIDNAPLVSIGRNFFQRLFWLALLACLLAFPSPSQAQTPEPPSVNLDAPRYDAGREVYLLDLVYTRPQDIGSLQVSIISAQGVEVTRISFVPAGANQTVELDARGLKSGEQYRVEVIGFTPAGKLIVGGQGGNSLLATREFTHLPDQVQLGVPRFKLAPNRTSLTIELDVGGGQAIAAYRVLFEDSKSNAVTLDRQILSQPPLQVPVSGIPDGDYSVTVFALDAVGKELGQVASKFAYAANAPSLGTPLFEDRANPPALLIRLQPANAQGIDHYAVSLVDKSTNQVALDYQAVEDKGKITIPLESLPAGTYQVLVSALDVNGNTLASAEGETSYVPPPPPGLLTRLGRGLAANLFIPILIVIIIVLLVAWLALRSLMERRATATPLLEGWGAAQPGAEALPVSHTMAVGIPQVKRPASAPVLPSSLQLQIATSPDKSLVGKTVLVAHYPFSIGRSGCDLNVSGDLLVSRRHAELRYNGNGLVLVDLLSRNGTFLNGERLAAEMLVPLNLEAEVRIRIGRETQLVLESLETKPTGR